MFEAFLGGMTARRVRAVVALALLGGLVAGCGGRPYGTLIATAPDPQAGTVDLMVATTRAPVTQPAGVMFGGSRGLGLDFADIVVSIPPGRAPGEVRWPTTGPADPTRDFAVLRTDRMTLAEAKANFDRRVRAVPGRRVLVFVHGFNTRFEEAVYRFAQIVYDSNVKVAPVLFTWPSGGNVTDYVYDRDSAMYSRDALEKVLQAIADDPNVGSISILAHSMGNYVLVESLRQMSIRDRGLPSKIRDVMLASPDIDVDVFRRQIATIDASPRTTQFTLFVSRDDRALGLSSLIARELDPAGLARPDQAALPHHARRFACEGDRPHHHEIRRPDQPREVRERRGRAGDRIAAGLGAAAQRRRRRSGRIDRSLHRRRHRSRRRGGHRGGDSAHDAHRSDPEREVGRHDEGFPGARAYRWNREIASPRADPIALRG